MTLIELGLLSPKIITQFDINLGEIIDIIINNMAWRITFVYTNNDANLTAIVTPNNAQTPIEIDVTDIKDEINSTTLAIRKVLSDVVYPNSSEELIDLIMGLRKATPIQKTFELEIIQPTIAADTTTVLDPWWKALFSQDGIVLFIIKRHMDTPDIFHVSVPNVELDASIYPENDIMQLSQPTILVNAPNDLVDLTITPTIEAYVTG